MNAEGDRSAHKRLDRADRKHANRRRWRRTDDDGRDARLGHQHRPAARQDGRGHRQHDHQSDLRRAGPEQAREQVSDKHSQDHPADQLKRPLAVLTDRRPEADQGGDRGKAGLPGAEQQLGEIPRGDGRGRGLQDRPQQAAQPPHVLTRTRGWGVRHRSKPSDCEDGTSAGTPGAPAIALANRRADHPPTPPTQAGPGGKTTQPRPRQQQPADGRRDTDAVSIPDQRGRTRDVAAVHVVHPRSLTQSTPRARAKRRGPRDPGSPRSGR
jgi:hypothetical protein